MTRVLIAGWPDFVNGVASAGDVLGTTAVADRTAPSVRWTGR